MFIITIIVGIGVLVFIIIMLKSLLFPRKISSLYNLIKSGKYQSVIRAAKNLAEKDPSNAEIHYLLGQAYNMDNKPDLALAEFNKVNKIGNFTGILNESTFRKAIAELFIRFNQDEEALKEYLLLIKSDPYNSNYQFLVGKLFEKRGKLDNAMGYYTKAVELDKRNDGALFNLGKLYYNIKKFPEAKSYFDDALKYNPTNIECHFYIGKIHKDTKNYPAAIASFDKAQKSPQLKPRAIIEKGITFIMSSNIDSAIIEFERALKLEKDISEAEVLNARYFLADCYEKNRKIIEAVTQWEIIYKKKQNFKDVAEKLNQYQDIRGDDSLKDFFTASNEEFLAMCVKILEKRGFAEREKKLFNGVCQVVVSEKKSGSAKPVLANFYRVAEPIDDSHFRAFTDDMKKAGAIKGIVFSSSGFTRKALAFIENRPVDAVNQEQLQAELKKI